MVLVERDYTAGIVGDFGDKRTTSASGRLGNTCSPAREDRFRARTEWAGMIGVGRGQRIR